MFCTNCGKELLEIAKFCDKCGTEISHNLKAQIENAKPITDYDKEVDIEDVDGVKFGKYAQSNITGEEEDPIEWVVLEKVKDKVLLLSKYILDCKSYGTPFENWDYSKIRSWLNVVFFDRAFDDEDRKKILETKIINKKGSEKENDTYDKVFLLSIEEIEKYFNQKVGDLANRKLATKGTEFSKRDENEEWGEKNKLYIYEPDSSAWCFCGKSFYWLRSHGCPEIEIKGKNDGFSKFINSATASIIDEHGIISKLLREEKCVGIRPAIWIKI